MDFGQKVYKIITDTMLKWVQHTTYKYNILCFYIFKPNEFVLSL